MEPAHVAAARRVRFWRMPWTYDARSLQSELNGLGPTHWRTHFNTGYHDGGWSGLALISADGDAGRLYADPNVQGAGTATALLAHCPALREVLASLPFVIQSARLLKLAPGSHIREHSDHGIGLDEGFVRLHVPIVTAPGVEFYLDGVRVPMGAGECWYLDFGLPHRVQNFGHRARVHLVIDCAVDDVFKRMLPTPEDSERAMTSILLDQPPTSQQRFEHFRDDVLRRPELQCKLADIEDAEDLVSSVVRLGMDNGLRFTEEDARSAMQAGRRAWIERHAFPALQRGQAAAGPVPSRSSTAALELDGWTPVMAMPGGDDLVVELCRLGKRRFTEPFFEDSIAHCMRQPFHSLFRQRLDAGALERWLVHKPGLTPTGFVFHMSRCGSTLLSQALAASPANRVMSEPGPIDAALRAGPRAADDPQRVRWLRTMLGLLGQAGNNEERHFFVKFDSWHAGMLPLIRGAYPDTPWVFLVRDPVEVIVSHLRMPGAQMVPGMLGYTPPGVEPVDAMMMSREEYCARMLGAICSHAVAEFERDPALGLIVDYPDLLGAMQGPLMHHLGLPDHEVDPDSMARVVQRDAKNPMFEFRPDTEAKRQEASEAVQIAAERWALPAYHRLRELARGCPIQAGAIAAV